MPLSDLFKKSPKKEPARDNPFGSPEMQKKRYGAAVEFLGVLQESLLSPNGRGHAGTNLAIAAWMAGTSLYRSMNYKHNPPPGTVMLSEEVNQAWPELLNLFLYYCQRSGVELKPDKFVTKTPDAHKPHMEILEAQKKFQDRYNEIMKSYGLNYLDGARAGMIVCSIVFQHHCTRSKDIDINMGAGIISMGVVEGAKTAPALLNPQNARSEPAPGSAQKEDQFSDLLSGVAQNSIDGSGTRLVLGEGMAPMGEALKNGGKYILVHPEVIKQLEESGIDGFLVYAAAMELDSQISQVDFISGNAAELIQQAQGKPERKLPMHVRQLLWLRENAGDYGYHQDGNSWILK